MNFEPRRLLHVYLSRRSPWGPPWWIYGVAFGAANVIRQIAIIATPAEVPQSIRVASWVATALLVVGVINGVAILLQRRAPGTERVDNHTGEMAHSMCGPSKEEP